MGAERGIGTGILGGEASGEDWGGLGVTGAVDDEEVAERNARLGLRGKRKREEERGRGLGGFEGSHPLDWTLSFTGGDCGREF